MNKTSSSGLFVCILPITVTSDDNPSELNSSPCNMQKNIDFDVSKFCRLSQCGWKLAVAPSQGSTGKLKFSWGPSQCKARSLTHAHTRSLKKKKKKEARLKLMPPFWRPQCPMQHVPTSYLLMRRSMTFRVSYFAPVLLNVSFCINVPVLKLNGFRFRSEWSRLPPVHQLEICTF